MKKRLLFVVVIVFNFVLNAQMMSEFTIELKGKETLPELGIQSFSWGKSGDEVLIIGGRLDGLHKRQPWASFDSLGHNQQLIVWNTKTNETWKAKYSNLTIAIFEQLKATNHCFSQVCDSLFIVGGYGISQKEGHITFASALRFSVSEVINAVKKNQLNNSLFEQFTSDNFAVTGGQIIFYNEKLHLVGGHRFDGRYNPQNGPSYVQTYTNAARIFTWEKGNSPIFYPELTNVEAFHKRDFNLLNVKSGEAQKLVALSGVFKLDEDLPFQTASVIYKDSFFIQPQFRQFYNHYDCVDISIYVEKEQTTHTFLLGGIAQFYDSLGVLTQDDNVPFTRSISRLSFRPDGSIEEYLLPTKMPDFIGAGSAFFENPEKKEIGLDDDEISLGLLFGGIRANHSNIFWSDDSIASVASSNVYEVILKRTDQLIQKNKFCTNPLNVEIERVGKKDRYWLFFKGDNRNNFTLTIQDVTGKTIRTQKVKASSELYNVNLKLGKRKGTFKISILADNNPQVSWIQNILVE